MTHHYSHRSRYSWGVAALATLVLMSGCAQPPLGGRGPGPDSSPGTSPDTSPRPGPAIHGPDDLVLRVELVHGFMPEYFVTQLPIVSVYGDGRVIIDPPGTGAGPIAGMARCIGPPDHPGGTVNALVAHVLDHGVGRDIDYGQAMIFDAPATVFTVFTDEGPLVTDVYALESVHDSDGLTDAQKSARQDLVDLIDDLSDLSRILGPDAGEQLPFEQTAIAVVAREWTLWGSPLGAPEPDRVWPGPTLPGSRLGHHPVHCFTVTGADATIVLDAAKTADISTRWTSDGRLWTVMFRPLLPDEQSCEDLI